MREQENGVRSLSRRTRERREATYDLEFDGPPLQLDSPNLEINTNSGDVALRISVVSKSKEQARLFGEGQRALLIKATRGDGRWCAPFRRLSRR